MSLRIRTGLVALAVAGAGAAVVVTALRPSAPAADRHGAAPVRTATTVTTNVTVTPVAATAPKSATAADLDAARDAAQRYLALAGQVLSMTEGEAVAAQREASTDAAGPALVDDLRRRLAALRAAFPAGGLRYRVAPLAVRVSSGGAGRASVELWYVGVLSAPTFAPYEEWRLSRYELVWERGEWRVAAESSGPGPRPASPPGPPPATAREFESVLDGFTTVAGRP